MSISNRVLDMIYFMSVHVIVYSKTQYKKTSSGLMMPLCFYGGSRAASYLKVIPSAPRTAQNACQTLRPKG